MSKRGKYFPTHTIQRIEGRIWNVYGRDFNKANKYPHK